MLGKVQINANYGGWSIIQKMARPTGSKYAYTLTNNSTGLTLTFTKGKNVCSKTKIQLRRYLKYLIVSGVYKKYLPKVDDYMFTVEEPVNRLGKED